MNRLTMSDDLNPVACRPRILPALLALAGALSMNACATRRLAVGRWAATSNEITEAAATAVTSPRSVASSLPEFFVTGPRIRRKMLELIEGASDYILIDSFLTVTDPITLELMEALKRKHASGVRVHVLADSSSRYMHPGTDGCRYLEKHGISVAEYNPMRIYKLIVAPVMLRRDHRKFWIVDGKVLFLGGANILATSLTHPREGGNHDLMVAVESAEAVARMIDSFVHTWNHSSRETLRAADFAVRTDPAAETRLWLFDQNRERQRDGTIEPMVAGLFAAAEEEIWLIQPYTFVTEEFLGQLRELSRRGVEVNVMLSSDVHASRFHYASFYGIEDIQKAGGKVWVYKAGMGALHAKIIIVDDRWASVGSANLNKRSYQLSSETNVVFEDPRSVWEVVQTLETLRKDCRLVTPEESRGYRSPEYLLAWLWMQWAG
jgi:cardiolipin synthase